MGKCEICGDHCKPVTGIELGIESDVWINGFDMIGNEICENCVEWLLDNDSKIITGNDCDE